MSIWSDEPRWASGSCFRNCAPGSIPHQKAVFAFHFLLLIYSKSDPGNTHLAEVMFPNLAVFRTIIFCILSLNSRIPNHGETYRISSSDKTYQCLLVQLDSIRGYGRCFWYATHLKTGSWRQVLVYFPHILPFLCGPLQLKHLTHPHPTNPPFMYDHHAHTNITNLYHLCSS